MPIPAYTKQFERDLRRMQRRGKDVEKLKSMMRTLIKGEAVDAIHRDHKLVGNWRGRRDCHVESDWLLLYKLEGEQIVFERTGSHADLFRR
jgi:mRNA interferase YafQ